MLTRTEAEQLIKNEHNERIKKEIETYMPELEKAAEKMLEKMRQLSMGETVEFPVSVNISGVTTSEARKHLLDKVIEAGWDAQINADRVELYIHR